MITLLLILVAGVYITGSLVAIVNLRNAREGYEDSEGFHYTSPKVVPVRVAQVVSIPVNHASDDLPTAA
ncbi:MAG TPA: hypothetical protein VKC60_00840 [Opitutaceae bacterium]|nr:hypothetical protein [Opitutaceae bacterium]